MKQIEFSLLAHLFIEFIHNSYTHRRGVLLEQTISRERIRLLLEKYGVFPECERIADQIMVLAEKHHNDRDTEVIKVDNCPFINNIIVVFFDGATRLSYLPDFTQVDDNGNFKTIALALSTDNETNTKSLVMHELQHVYEDWNLRIKGKTLTDEMEKSGYYRAQMQPNDSVVQRMVKELFYFFNKPELNAYITKIVQDIKGTDKHFYTVSELFDYVKKLPIYRKYMQVIDRISEFENITNHEMKRLILKYINSIRGKGKEFDNYRQFISWLRRKGFKTKKKMDVIVVKAIYDKFNGNMAKSVSFDDGLKG